MSCFDDSGCFGFLFCFLFFCSFVLLFLHNGITLRRGLWNHDQRVFLWCVLSAVVLWIMFDQRCCGLRNHQTVSPLLFVVDDVGVDTGVVMYSHLLQLIS